MLTSGIERAIGHRVDALLDRPLLELVHPDDQPSVVKTFGAVAAAPGSTATAELRIRASNGEHRYFEITCTNLLADPIVTGLLVHGRDITERRATLARLREREHAFASLLGNLHGMAYRARKDEDWIVELVTDGSTALIGLPPEALIGGKVLELRQAWMHPDDLDMVLHKSLANLEARRPFAEEYRIRTKSGEERWVLDVASGVYGPSGELTAIDGFVTDVTARRKLEEQLNHSQKLEGIGRLAGGIAHDFNNLLGAMLSYSDLVLEEIPATSQAGQDIQEIRAAAMRAADLTSQLLAFARKQVLQPKVLDLNQTVMKLDRLLRRIVGADIDLSTIAAPDLWAVAVDPSQIDQVLLNLAVNARDAMPNGGRLTIETQNVTLDEAYAATRLGVVSGDYVMLAVSDTGEGMTEETRQRIFEPFFSTKGQHGTGLGLATCYGVVRQAGGHIFVYSEIGHGSSFKIYLPRSLQPLDEDAAEDPESTAALGRGEVVLVVEDHAQLREVMIRTLTKAGYRVLAAEDASGALELGSEPIDLLLTDIVMPGMTGHELAAQMTDAQKSLRVLYVSGYTENSVIHRGVPTDRVHFLAKPFSTRDLRRKVREVLDAPAHAE